MGAARARRDLLHDRQVGLLLELALDDQVASPRLEPEGALDRVLLVVDAQGEDEVRLGLPGDLELDAGPGGEPEVAADRRALAVGHRLARFLAPVLLPGRLVPAEQAVRPEIDQVGAVAPAVDPMEVGPLDVDPAQPRDVQLDLLVVQAEQRAEQDVARGQLEAEIAGRLGQRRRRRPLDGVDVSRRRNRTGRRTTRPASARSRAGPTPSAHRPRTLHWRVAARAATGVPRSVPRRSMSRSRARPPRPPRGVAGETEEPRSRMRIAGDGCTSGRHLWLIVR